MMPLDRYTAEALEAHPLPWHQGKMAHEGGTIWNADNGHVFTIHGNHAVAVAALIVALVNRQ